MSNWNYRVGDIHMNRVRHWGTFAPGQEVKMLRWGLDFLQEVGEERIEFLMVLDDGMEHRYELTLQFWDG